MSCNNENAYNSICREDIPYPQVSSESVPSLVDNLVYALYGNITKSVVANRVVWNIPCDPNNSAEVPTIPRIADEGLLCYLMRVFQATVGQLGVPQGGLRWSLTGNNITTTLSLTGATTANPTGYLVAIDGVVQDPASYTINSAVSPFVITMSQPIPSGSVMVVIEIASAIAGWFAGSGNPNGVLVAPIGSIYVNTLGGQGQTFWVKEVGTGNTGWSPLSSGSSGPPVPAGGNSYRFIGNGSTAIFPLAGATATTSVSYIVSIDGVLQDPIDYVIDNSTSPRNLVMSNPVPNLSKIVIVG